MTSRYNKFLAMGFAAIVVSSGYFMYALFAAQGQGGRLAQAPLNTQIQVTPAFIMAVDDSGSMDSEVVLPTNDGAAWWRTGGSYQSFMGLDQNDLPVRGILNFNRGGGASANWKKYVYLFPFGQGGDRRVLGDATNDHFALPPIADFAWARSPFVNRSYFDPRVTYEPWLEADGRFLQGVTGIDPATGQVSPTAAPADPKNGTTRLDLTKEWARTGANQTFMFQVGMVIPKDTVYSPEDCDQRHISGLPSDEVLADGWRVAKNNRNVSGSGATVQCKVAVRFFPASFYVEEAAASAVALSIGYVGSGIEQGEAPDGTRLRLFEIRSGNFESPDRYQAAINNFANWFTYYRKRNLATRAGMSRAFAASNDSIRAGYFKINNRTDVTMRNLRVAEDKRQFFNSIFSLYNTSGGTPNKEAVNFMGQQFERGRGDNGRPVELACQRNIGMLFTDGFSNNASISGITNVDGDDKNRHFNHHPVFSDGVGGTMADIAAHYYSNLRSDLTPGQVPIPTQCAGPSPDPRLDCNSNPHMNFFAVTLNGRGLQYGTNQAATADPYANVPVWPTQFFDRHPSAIDDLWHATINARGALINASRPSDIAAALGQILTAVNAGPSPSGSIAITGARIGAGTLQVTPSYDVQNNATDWAGELEASAVMLNAERAPITSRAWRASERLQAHDARRVYFAKGSAAPVRFAADAPLALSDLCELDGCTPSQIESLGDSVTVSSAIDYLLGDVTKERRNGGPFRDRGTRLGDFVHSTPVISAPTDDYGYGALKGELGASYATYRNTKASRRYMVYVGGNGGMLHAFNGGLTKSMVESNVPPDANGGREEFGYIPTTALGHLGNLLFPFDASPTARQFRHRYYVDGQISVSDAHYNDAWKTVLVGAAGAGGRSVFALDVSDPSSFSESNRLWEISDLNTSLDGDVRDDIGHVLGRPVIVPVKNKAGGVAWKAIFGNGYESASGRAVLFLVDIDSGPPKIRRVVAREPSSGLAATSANGLGNIVVLDRWAGEDLSVGGRDGYADTVYAADRQGAIWKFDIRDADPDHQTVPLFVTQEYAGSGGRFRQPITGGLTATVGPRGGITLYFGTGSFVFENDHTDANVQSLYAVNDLSRGAVSSTVSLSGLVRYEVSAIAGSTDRTIEVRSSGAGGGWYVNLPPRERFIGNPEIAAGVVFMPTYSPNPGTSGCSTTGFNSLFGLNARTGAPALSQVRYGTPGGASPKDGTAAIELDTGGTAPVRDVGVMAIPRLGPPALPAGTPGTPPPAPPSPPEQGCWMHVSVAGAEAMLLPYPCGRQSWRQIQ